VLRFFVWAISAALRPKALLVGSYWCCSACARSRAFAIETGSFGFAPVDGSLVGGIPFLL